MSFITRLSGLVAVAAFVGLSHPVAAAVISGAWAKFPIPSDAKWVGSSKKVTNTGLNFQTIGYCAGIEKIFV